MPPGINRAADWSQRASFLRHGIPQGEDPVIALASVFTSSATYSVPFEHPTTPKSPTFRQPAGERRLLHKQAVLLRIGATPITLLGRSEANRFFEPDGREELIWERINDEVQGTP